MLKRWISRLKDKDRELTFQEHVHELSLRLILVGLCFAVLFVLIYVKSADIIQFLLDCGMERGYQFVYLAPQEILLQRLKLAGLMAVIGSVPVFTLVAIDYVLPGFSFRKLLGSLLLVAVVGGMFTAGVYAAHRWLMPFMLDFLKSINQVMSVRGTVDVAKYVGFLSSVYIAFGAVAELPVVVIGLTVSGAVSYKVLIKIQPVVTVAIFVVAALITPPDVVSQLAVGIPMLLLYEMSIVISYLLTKHRRRQVCGSLKEN